MPFSASSFIVAVASFATAFVLVRLLARWWKARHPQQEQEEHREGESRQVRRARQRQKKSR